MSARLCFARPNVRVSGLNKLSSPQFANCGDFYLTNFSDYAMIKLRIGDGTHHKKRYLHPDHHTKGATPIEKNVIVVDEQGNEYEATYPKRAKGLVKNGRARFIAENKICLACSPDTHSEGKTMSEILNKVRVFEQIVKLQEDLESLDSILFKIQLVSDSQKYDQDEEGNIVVMDYMPEVSLEKIKAIREIVMTRETTLRTMLDFYLSVYKKTEEEEI